MTWCLQATSYCLSQCWPRSMFSHGITRPQYNTAPLGYHCSDYTWTSWCLKSLSTQLFVQQITQANNNENITGSTSLALCEGNPPMTDEQRCIGPLIRKALTCHDSMLMRNTGNWWHFVQIKGAFPGLLSSLSKINGLSRKINHRPNLEEQKQWCIHSSKQHCLKISINPCLGWSIIH